MFKKDGKEVQACSMITEEQSEWMNRNKDAYKIRYVLEEEKIVEDDNIIELQEAYFDKFGKKAHHLWKSETIKEKLEA